MPDQPIVDIHAHILAEDTISLLQKEVPTVAPRLTPIDDEFSVLEVDGKAYKPFPRGTWDLERRLSDMDRYGYDMQVVAVSPQTLLYGLDPAITLAVCQIQNDQIAALHDRHPEKFLGLATVPLQDGAMSAQELKRAMAKPGIRGVQIGTSVLGRNLDDPDLEPFWATSEDLGAFVIIHPLNALDVPRIGDYYLKNFIGNPLDTTIAAASLVFGGVLQRYPRLKICLVHGGGFVPYQAGRFVHGWEKRQESKVRLTESPRASLDRLLYDTVLHDRDALQFLISSVGAGRVMHGTDYPFDMGQYDAVDLVRSLDLSQNAKAEVLGGSAIRLLSA